MRKSLFFFVFLWFALSLAGCGAAKKTEAGSEGRTGDFRVFVENLPGCDGITIDGSGNMYVGSRSTNEMYRIDPGGKAVRFADMPCSELLCMTVGPDNSIYAAGRDSLLRVSPGGQVSVLLNGFACADDLRLDPNGVIYLVDASDNLVYRITPDMKKTVFIPDQIGKENLGKWEITGITFDLSYQYLYIARMNRGRIERYPILADGTAGSAETIADNLPGCDHLEMDTEGRLYVTLFNGGSLVRIYPDKRQEMLVQGGFFGPTGIVFGRAGFNTTSVYIADYRRGRVYEVPVGATGMPLP